MKKVIKFSKLLTLKDVRQSVSAGWLISSYKNKRCLENEKTIFIPFYMPKP